MRGRKAWFTLACIVLAYPGTLFAADDHGNDCTVATPISTDGTSVQGLIQASDPETDQDWFSFTVTAGSSYSIRNVNPDSSIYGTVEGIDCTTDILWHLWLKGSPPWSFTASESGTYFLRVSGTASEPLSIPYEIAVTEYQDDHGNSFTEGSFVTVNGVAVSGELEVAGDRDYFSFTAAEGENYIIRTEHGSLSSSGIWVLPSFYDYTGIYDQYGPCAFTWSVAAGAGGEKQFSLQSLGSPGTGTYSVSISTYMNDHGSSRADSTIITADNSVIYGETGTARESDYFTFLAAPSTWYRIRLTESAELAGGAKVRAFTDLPSVSVHEQSSTTVLVNTPATSFDIPVYVRVSNEWLLDKAACTYGSGGYSVSVGATEAPGSSKSSSPLLGNVGPWGLVFCLVVLSGSAMRKVRRSR